MRSIFRLLPVAALLASPAALATNAVSSIVFKDGTVEITAESPPNFTTFTMANPVRLVIDLSDCVLMKVPAETSVDQGAVKTIKAAAFGDGSSAVARVTIEFSAEVETQIASRGNSLLVKISASPAVAANAEKAPAPASPDSEPSDVAPPAEAKALPPPPPVAEPPPPAAAAAPAAVAAATPPPPAPEPVPAAAPPPPAPPPPAKPTIAEVIPALQTTPPPAPPAAEPPPAPAAVAAAPPPPPEPTPPPPPEPPPPPKPTIAEVIQAPPTPPPPAPTPPAEPPAAAEAQPPPPAPAEPAPMQAPVQVSNRRKRLALVGFRPGSGNKATQVFIRTNEPVHYTVSENGTSLTVVVENTRVTRHNDLRPLDARFFATPVDSIAARQVKHDVIVEIRLKATAPYHAVQNGDEVQIDFEPARAAERALPPQENTAG